MKLRMDSAAAVTGDGTAVYGAIPPELQRILPNFSRYFKGKRMAAAIFYSRNQEDVKNVGEIEKMHWDMAMGNGLKELYYKIEGRK